MDTHVNTQISMHQHLKIKVLGSLILHLERSPETILRKGDTVQQSELIRPCLPELLAQHGMGEAEIELDGIVAVLLVFSQRFGRRLTEELPVRVPREAMLGERGGRVVLGRRAEDLDYRLAGIDR